MEILIFCVAAAFLLHVPTVKLMGDNQDFHIEKFRSAPGLYYDDQGKVQIYSVTWRIVSYVNLMDLKKKSDETAELTQRAIGYCKQKLVVLDAGHAECDKVQNALSWHINKIQNSQSLIGQLARHGERRKRGILNVVGEISKILFGTLDEQDASYFKSKIDLVEGEQRQLLKLTKEQVTVVKAALTSFNYTLVSLARNEEVIVAGMEKIHKYINEYTNSTDRRIQQLAVLTAVNEQLIQLTSIFLELEREYDLMISALVNAQKGVLEPHIINPVQVVRYLKLIRDDLRDKQFPIALAEENGYQLLRLIDIDVFLSGHILSYVLNVPLVENNLFNLYGVLPLPAEIDASKHLYMYIAPERDFLIIDQAKRQYAKLGREQLLCKEINKRNKICKQTFVLLSTYDHETCEARMLQPIREIPADCVQKLVTLNDSIWTSLGNNEWLFVAPKGEGLTILCNDNKPVDVLIQGTGKLKFVDKCKGYGTHVFFQSEQLIKLNVTNEDIVPDLNMDTDCIIDQEKRNISELKLHLPIEPIVRHLDELKVAGHKISELETEIALQEKYSFSDFHLSPYSFATYVGILCVVVIVICCLCRHCKCCRDCFRFFWRRRPDDCCGGICVQSAVVTNDEGIEISSVRARRPLRAESHESVALPSGSGAAIRYSRRDSPSPEPNITTRRDMR